MTAIVTGISGQDGFYMARRLRREGIPVVGLTSRAAKISAVKQEFYDDPGIVIEAFDYSKPGEFEALVKRVGPRLIFNFAAYATGQGMFDDPLAMARLNGYFVSDILEAIRRVDQSIAFCQASSAEMFGNVFETPQSETTPFRPISPYGAAKAYAHHMIGVYRDAYGMNCRAAILYNHESPRRGTAFVTRKVARAAAAISLGLESQLTLGTLDIERDWGYAPEYVDAMYLMATAPSPRDYVLATGRLSSIREVCAICFGLVGLDYHDYVRLDEGLRRPVETLHVLGDARRIREDLGWEAHTSLVTILKEMVDNDLASLGANR
jgi:GDPmannose 4,6-dehydratase